MAVQPIHPQAPVSQTRTKISRGYTLIELMLALTIMSLVATVVATLLYSVSRGTNSRDVVLGENTAIAVACARINAAIRPGGQVLAQGNDFLVIWTSDANGSMKPNISEMRRLELNPATKELTLYGAPASLPRGTDNGYDLAQNFDLVTRQLRNTEVFTGTTLINGIQSWTPACVGPMSSSRLVTYTVTLAPVTTGNNPLTAKSSAALRGQVSFKSNL